MTLTCQACGKRPCHGCAALLAPAAPKRPMTEPPAYSAVEWIMLAAIGEAAMRYDATINAEQDDAYTAMRIAVRALQTYREARG